MADPGGGSGRPRRRPDRRSGRCEEETTLSDACLEFPSLDPRLVGLDARFGYAIAPATIGGPNRYGPPFQVGR